MKNNNKIIQPVYTYVKGNRYKQVTIKYKGKAWRPAFPIISLARIENLRPHFLIPEKGILIELNSLDFDTANWYDQFLDITMDITYTLYVQLIFSDIPFVLSYKIKFVVVAHRGPIEGNFIFFDAIRNEIVSQIEMKMKINGIYEQYLDCLKSHNFFYRARLVLKNPAKSRRKKSKRKQESSEK